MLRNLLIKLQKHLLRKTKCTECGKIKRSNRNFILISQVEDRICKDRTTVLCFKCVAQIVRNLNHSTRYKWEYK